MYRTVRAQACQACGTGLAVGPYQCVKKRDDGALVIKDHATEFAVVVPATWIANLNASLRELGS